MLLSLFTALCRQVELIILEYFRFDAMASPVKDLPKMADELKGELLKERSLKPTEAQEKNVLPSAEDVKQEKTHQNMLTGDAVNNFKNYIDRWIDE